MSHHDQHPIWDRPRGPTIKEAPPLQPFYKIDEPWRARRARQAISTFALSMGASYALSAFSVWGLQQPRPTILFGNDPNWVAASHIGLILIAIALATLVKRSNSLIYPSLCMAWAIAELYPPFTYALTGHGGFFGFSILSLSCAIIAIRGVAYDRKQAKQIDPSGDPPSEHSIQLRK